MLVPVFKYIEFPTSLPERKRFITDYTKKDGISVPGHIIS